MPFFIEGVKYILMYFLQLFGQIPLLSVASVMFSRNILCNGQFVIKLVKGKQSTVVLPGFRARKPDNC